MNMSHRWTRMAIHGCRSGEVRTKRNPDYIDLPELPGRGDLDLEAIADSIYCFL